MGSADVTVYDRLKVETESCDSCYTTCFTN